ncbi:shikimate kinase [Halobacillus shinanisalinarum]|uniref:Shikimate kinase n=1 Tax=Halobacillus shinanisalinarum TaxID=2932258 RepID=A0ABY4H0A3_9BACI|nr:shikimate kinase [Halobacillus shinanisalinarum]UOQ93721.1 shikimate kinase [Halobacillus shinanisalinarum]
MIFLIGYMGSGKSTIAKRLSEVLQCTYIEMDEEIERREGMTIPEVFTNHGETFFRAKESQLLKELEGELIVSTGGGVVLSAENRQALTDHFVIYLEASFKTIQDRLAQSGNRPLWSGDSNEKQKRFNERKPLYEKVAIGRILVDDKDPAMIVEEILLCLKKNDFGHTNR